MFAAGTSCEPFVTDVLRALRRALGATPGLLLAKVGSLPLFWMLLHDVLRDALHGHVWALCHRSGANAGQVGVPRHSSGPSQVKCWVEYHRSGPSRVKFGLRAIVLDPHMSSFFLLVFLTPGGRNVQIVDKKIVLLVSGRPASKKKQKKSRAPRIELPATARQPGL